MSLGPQKREERAQARRAAFERAMPLENFAPIGCLECRRCQVTPETNLGDSIVRIYCEKKKAMMPARLEPDCSLADPRPARPRHLHRLWVGHGDLGDKASKATPLLILYLKKFWILLPAATLELQTGRDINSLRQIVRSYGVGGAATDHNRIALSGHEEGRDYFTAAQTEWLEKTYNSTLWPAAAIHKKSDDELKAIEKRRQWIIDHVATVGPRWTWKQITHHLEKRRMKKNASRKKRQEAHAKGNNNATTV